MRAINHALTGALIGLSIMDPLLAVPAALASHIVCDVIPHHAASQKAEAQVIRSSVFRRTLLADALLCVTLVVILAVRRPHNWLLAAVCAFVAASPDLLYLNRYRAAVSRKAWNPSHLVQLLIDIQWFQRPIGAVVEIVWFAGACVLLAPWLS